MAPHSRVGAAVEALRSGRFVLIVDEAEREDDGEAHRLGHRLAHWPTNVG